MRAVIQRVDSASVNIGETTVGSCGRGFLILLGVGENDTEEEVEKLWAKIFKMRIFPDGEHHTGASLADVAGEVLVISQFTLYADCRKGNRPSFVGAAAPDLASPLVDRFVELLKEQGVPTQTGVFGAHMDVDLLNSGPVTIILEY